MDAKTVLTIAAVVGIGAWLLKRQATAAVKAVGTAVNPVSDQNIFYQGASSVTSAVTGSNEPLGAQIYDWFH